jgi:hypothetical protein
MSNPTPTEERAAEDLELQRRVAEAMGWTDVRQHIQPALFGGEGRAHLYGISPGEDYFVEVPDPLTDPRETEKAKQWILDKGYGISLHIQPDGSTVCQIWPPEGRGAQLTNKSGDTEAIAVCRALLAVVEWEQAKGENSEKAI